MWTGNAGKNWKILFKIKKNVTAVCLKLWKISLLKWTVGNTVWIFLSQSHSIFNEQGEFNNCNEALNNDLCINLITSHKGLLHILFITRYDDEPECLPCLTTRDLHSDYQNTIIRYGFRLK